jgi:hypothetical protein
MGTIHEALERQRKAEEDFVADARENEKAPKGWPVALIMFHCSMWRERLLHAMAEIAEGRPQPPPPGNVDDVNDAELASGIGTPLADAAARSDKLFCEIIELYGKLGDRPIEWNTAKTTTEAVLRNSYIHPRNHMFAYLEENGEDEEARLLFEEAEAAMREAEAPPAIRAAAMCNLAGVRGAEGRKDEAFELLRESFSIRPEMRVQVARDAKFSPLHGDPRFGEILKA